MQVSAVSPQYNYGYIFSAKLSLCDTIGDTSFNSLTPINTNIKRNIQQTDLKQVYDNIYEWKDFCHKQILSGKFDVIA